MSRLVKTVKGSGTVNDNPGRVVGSTPLLSSDDSVPAGIVVDGVVYPLEGQPPIAHGGNWFKPST